MGSLADNLVLAHPGGQTGTPVMLAVLGGPALVLLGNLLIKCNITGRIPASHRALLTALATGVLN